jgi:hypothetical protein
VTQLPFPHRVVVEEQGGAVVARNVPLSPIWPAGLRTGNAGVHADHECEAPLDQEEHLRGQRRRINLDGRKYVIVDVQRNEFVPHLVVLLRSSAGA